MGTIPVEYKQNDLIEALGGVQVPQATAVDSDLDLSVDVQQLTVDAAQAQQLAKTDLDFFAAMLMPTIFNYNFPDTFKSVWHWLLSYVELIRVFPKLALGLPRGFGKSTLMKVFIVYCILFTTKKFILIVAENQKKANNILSDIMDMLEEENVKALFGDWKLGCEKDTQDTKKFGYRGRNIILAAIGSEGGVRGLNLKNERPDIILMDDIQSREVADSEVQSESLEQWMVGSLMKAKDPTGCMFLFVGNMYPTKYSILRKLKNNPTWVKFICGGILANGESLWEDLQPRAQLMEEFENDLAMGRPEIFYAEVLNDENVQANNLINLAKLPPVPYQEGDIAGGNFVIIDPSNDKANSDFVSVGYFEVHSGYPILMELVEDRLSPGDTIKQALKFCLTHNCRLIAVEANAYQYSLLYWFSFVCQQLQITGIESVPLYSGSRSKNARIMDYLKSYAAGEIFAVGTAKLLLHAQITSFNPLITNNVDGILDLMTYAPRVMTEFGEYVVSTNIIDMQDFEAVEVPDFNSPF